MKRKRRLQKAVLPAPTPEVMDIKALASYLKMGRSKIYSLIRQKKIPASRIGRQYRFSKSVVDAWLKEQIIPQADERQMSLFKK